MKYYFNDGETECGTLAYWRDYMNKHSLKELVLFLSKRMEGAGTTAIVMSQRTKNSS